MDTGAEGRSRQQEARKTMGSNSMNPGRGFACRYRGIRESSAVPVTTDGQEKEEEDTSIGRTQAEARVPGDRRLRAGFVRGASAYGTPGKGAWWSRAMARHCSACGLAVGHSCLTFHSLQKPQ